MLLVGDRSSSTIGGLFLSGIIPGLLVLLIERSCKKHLNFRWFTMEGII